MVIDLTMDSDSDNQVSLFNFYSLSAFLSVWIPIPGSTAMVEDIPTAALSVSWLLF